MSPSMRCATCGSDDCLDPYQLIALSNLTKLRDRVAALENALSLYDNSAQKFVDKCDTGRAKSVETYMELKSCLAASKEARKRE